MADDFIIREIHSDDGPAVEELHRLHYWRSNCVLLNRTFYRWQFVEPPECGGRDRSVVAVDRSGRLLSFLGLVPTSATARGRNVAGAHLISWLSTPDSRGKGVGHSLMSDVAKRYDFLFGRSVTPSALAIYRRLGFRYFPTCSRWIAVLDSDAAMTLAIEPSGVTEKRARARVLAPALPEVTEVSPAVPSGAGALAAEVLRDAVGFERTDAMLAWRYARHPVFPYRFVAVRRGGTLRGFAVARVEDVRGRLGRVLRVVELVARQPDAADVARAVLAFGKSAGCAYADLFGMSEHFAAGFVTAGGFAVGEEPDLKLPHLLQPWDPDISPPGLLFYAPSVSSTARAIDDVSAIHVTRGDGNMDWPSWCPDDTGKSFAPSVRQDQPE